MKVVDLIAMAITLSKTQLCSFTETNTNSFYMDVLEAETVVSFKTYITIFCCGFLFV